MDSVSDVSRDRPWLVSGRDFVDIQIIAKTGSTSRRVVRLDPRGLVVALRSAPIKGEANNELIAFMADLLGTSRTLVTITRGHTARVKTMRIVNPAPVRVAELLRAYPSPR
jgi:uncharacterized protein YggU (UPF0235/DUF167 family)